MERKMISLKRNAIQSLLDWKSSEERKPMVLKGACVKMGLNQEKTYK